MTRSMEEEAAKTPEALPQLVLDERRYQRIRWGSERGDSSAGALYFEGDPGFEAAFQASRRGCERIGSS